MTHNSSGINHLALNPAGHYNGLGLVFDVCVDGKSFLTQIAEYEKRFHDKINGAYTAALGCRDIMNNMSTITSQGSTFTPYACDCGEWQCWFFQGVITGYGNFVLWGQWRNPYRDDKAKKSEGLYWCYKEFPTLCFDKEQYFGEIAKAQTLVKSDSASQKILGLPT